MQSYSEVKELTIGDVCQQDINIIQKKTKRNAQPKMHSCNNFLQ